MQETTPTDHATLVRRTATAVEGPPAHDPETYWRIGFTVPAVAAGYAFPREDVVDDVQQALAEAGGVLLVGQRGSGKSTICKQVVTRWLEDERGPVYHAGAVDAPASAPQVDADGIQADQGGTEIDGFQGDRASTETDTPSARSLVVIEDALRQDPAALAGVLERTASMDEVCVLVEARQEGLEQLGDRSAYGDDAIERCRRRLGSERFQRVTVPALEPGLVESITTYFADLVGDAVDEAAIEGDVGRPSTGPAVGHEWLQLAHALTADSGYADALDRVVADAYEAVTADGPDSLRAQVALAVNFCNAARIPCSDSILYGLGDDPEMVDAAIASLAGTVLTSGEDGRFIPPHEIWSGVYVRQLVEQESRDVARAAFGRVANHILAVASVRGTADAPGSQDEGSNPGESTEDESTARGAREDGDEESIIADRFDGPSGEGRSVIMTAPAQTRRTSMTVASVLSRLGEFGTQWPVLSPLFQTGDDATLEIPASCTPLTRAGFVTQCGEIHLARGDLDRAGACFDDAMATVREASPSPAELDKASVHYHLDRSKIAQKRGAHDEAVEHLETARETATERGYRGGEARALLELGTVRSKQGEMAAAFDAHQASLEHFQSLGDQRMTAKVLKEMGNLQFRRGDYEGASEQYEQALTVYRRLGERNGEASCLSNLGVVATYQERFDDARDYQERSLAIREQIGARALIASTLNNLGIVERRTGSLRAAREYYERSLEIKEEMGDREGVASSLGNLGVVHRELGNLELAEEYNRRSLEIYEAIGAPRNQAKCLNDLGRIYLEQDRLEDAESVLERARENFDGTDDEAGIGRSNACLGELALARDDQEGALAHFERSFEALAAAGTFEAIEAATNAAKVAHDLDDDDLVAEFLADARAYAIDHDFTAQFESHLADLDWELEAHLVDHDWDLSAVSDE